MELCVILESTGRKGTNTLAPVAYEDPFFAANEAEALAKCAGLAKDSLEENWRVEECVVSETTWKYPYDDSPIGGIKTVKDTVVGWQALDADNQIVVRYTYIVLSLDVSSF